MPSPLTRILGRRSRLEALRCLFSDSAELSGREIARRAGLSHPVVHSALRELEAEGIVERRAAPPTHQYRLNRRHWMVRELLAPLFEREKAGPAHLERLLARRLPRSVISLILFGSAVKGAFAPASDIDLLALVNDRAQKENVQEHLRTLGREVYESFRHPLSPVVLSVEEFRRQYKEGGKFAREISYSGRVIHGKLLTEVLFEHGGKKD